MEGGWRATMPAGGPHGVFEITVERLDIPAHVIEIGQFVQDLGSGLMPLT